LIFSPGQFILIHNKSGITQPRSRFSSSRLPGTSLEPEDFLEISLPGQTGYSPENNYPEFFPEARLKRSAVKSRGLWGQDVQVHAVMTQDPPGIIARIAIYCRSSEGKVPTHD